MDHIFKIVMASLSLMLMGCGGGGETKDDTSILDARENPYRFKETYYLHQWYLEYNSSYYNKYNINIDAGIHGGEVLEQYNGKGVTIAIIDDGLDISHPEINHSIVATYDISTGSANVAHNSLTDYHGTAVTGIIAAAANAEGILGLARESRIVFLKHKSDMSDSETIELFRKAEELGADIINCSWGTYDVSPAVKETIQDLAINGRDGKGIIIVFAVGNNDRDMGNDESAIPEVIAVGSTDKDNLRAWYSNYGEHLDLLAPGGYDVGITTIDPVGSSGIATEDEDYLLGDDPRAFVGTSASAPIVTGALAMLLERNENLTREDIESILKSSSDKIGNMEYDENGFNIYYGYGKLNLKRLMEAY